MSEIELYELLEKVDNDETIELIHAYYSIRNPELRLRVLEILESLTDCKNDASANDIVENLKQA